MSAEQPESSSARRYVLFAIKIAVSVILLTVLFSRIDTGRLWASARRASLPWLCAAIAVNFLSALISTWRWHILLRAQDVHVPYRTLLGSILVGLFFNNFLPSNIGGDVIRVRDTARLAGSKTMATTVILVDRVMGLMGLVLVAALGATMAVGLTGHGPGPIWPSWLWGGLILAALVSAPAVLVPAGVGRLLQPLTVFHPEWVGDRIDIFTAILERFRHRPAALAGGFVGAVVVQASTVVAYVTVAHALSLEIRPWDLAVIVPLSFVVQMLPVSLNGFGVREAAFTFYFGRVGQSMESALLLSLVATAVFMVSSLSGAAVYVVRGHH